MNIAIILATSLMVFAGFRLLFIFLSWALNKLFASISDNTKFDLIMSIAFFFMFIQCFLGAVQGVTKNNELSNAEWYFVYTFVGISAMIWCYFSWELKVKARPQFAKEKTQMIVKKILVFAVVMAFAFYHGYTQLNEKFGGGLDEDKKVLITLTNVTIIPGIIAFDRVLNQMSAYLNEKNIKK